MTNQRSNGVKEKMKNFKKDIKVNNKLKEDRTKKNNEIRMVLLIDLNKMKIKMKKK